MSDMVLNEVRDGIGYITIDRPDRRNAISPEVVEGISNHLTGRSRERSRHAVVLTGAGNKAFCAGGDLGGGSLEGGKVSEHFRRSEVGALFEQMRKSRLPIVARVNGHALAGGFGLMLACDLVIAADEAEMGTPEVNIGLWPFMISAIIQRDVPRKVALEFMLHGPPLEVDRGRAMGLRQSCCSRRHARQSRG